MKNAWTKGLDKDEASDMLAEFTSSKRTRLRLIKMLEDRISSCVKTATNEVGYENNNWAYKQADFVGETRAYRKIIALLDEVEEN